MTSIASDLFLFVAVSGLFLFHKKAQAAETASCDAELLNSAFVFVKPHANTLPTQKMVRDKLIASGSKCE